MRTPWRIGSTSYVYQGDLLHNLRALAGEVEDVELILFDDGNGTTNIPARGEVREMAALLAEKGMSVTIHLPRDVGGLLSDADLKSALDLNLRVIDVTRNLSPVAYIVHAHTLGNGTQAWQTGVMAGLSRLVAAVERPRQLALENLESYAPEHLEPIFAQMGVSRTLDIGHLWKQRRDPLEVIEKWLPTTSVIHLHGVREKEGCMVDHLSLAQMEENGRFCALASLLPALAEYNGVLTLEVFEDDYFTSRAALNWALARGGEVADAG